MATYASHGPPFPRCKRGFTFSAAACAPRPADVKSGNSVSTAQNVENSCLDFTRDLSRFRTAGMSLNGQIDR